ncbi:MAG: aldolase/citrate lyase family protein [Sphaerochaeta sp.]|nr:aldolase/citrate lyase family protein [Sphaerochaeta sp.]
MKSLKQKFKDCDLITGMHICLSDPAVTELCASLGYDFLWIDTEHSPMDYQSILLNLIAARAGGTAAIIRIPDNDPVLAKRVLEMGGDGIIFPMVCSKEESDRAIASTLYPPKGIRGFGPQRAVMYGLKDAAEYVNTDSLEMIRIIQVETAHTIEYELDAMLDNPWVDCVMLGPCDLAASIGRLPDITCKESVRLQDKALEKIRKAGKSAGTSIGSTDAAWIRSWYDRGANVISCGTETGHIINGASQTLAMIRGEAVTVLDGGAI